MLKIRACFRCKEYVKISENDYRSSIREKAFIHFHAGCPTQVINEREAEALKNEGYSEFILMYGDID